MKAEERRQEIVNRLSASKGPISAGTFSQLFGVSRQIIVKDIARLREDGYPVTSLNRGYLLNLPKKPERIFKMIHSDEDVETELNLIVDAGGVVEDVFIYHKAYHKVTARMDIKSRRDVARFLENMTSGKSSHLKNATSGYHYHTVSADSAETLSIIEEKLRESGFWAPLQEYEPEEMFEKK
ncbi:MAG: transcription repressor NadR [Ruminococcaceae bacterium]|nr:transcription repressor NadR [Oscillospiraceae bacterium]